jgi:hypothetical protein
LLKEKYKFAIMASKKKNTAKKNKMEKLRTLSDHWDKANQVPTLFPEKLARANEMLKNAKMLP